MSLSFIKSAEQGNSSAMAFIATIFTTIGGFLIGQTPLTYAVYYRVSQLGLNFKDYTTIDTMGTLFPYPVFFSLIMLQFLIPLIILFLCVKFIHRRKISTLFSSESLFRKREFIVGILFTMVMLVGADLIYYFNEPTDFKWSFNAIKFFSFLPFAIILIPIQTGFEELFFRGYLYQGTGLLFRNKWLALIICSLLFGSVHFMNPEIYAFGFWKMAIIYIGTGFMIGLSVLLTNGIEFAFGFHLINNFYLSVVKSFPGSALQGPTLFTLPKPQTNQILVEFLIEFIVFTLFILILYRKNIKKLTTI